MRLDFPLPEELAVGRGTAIFVGGWCNSPQGRIRSLAFVLDGSAQPVMAHGMPRLDVFRALHPGLDPFDLRGLHSDPGSTDDPLLTSYQSGFWGLVSVPPRREGEGEELTLLLQATLEDGAEASAQLGAIRVADRETPVEVEAPAAASGPLVAICMATYEPPLDLFARQIESIRDQTHGNWVCVVSDDCSSPQRFAAIEQAVADEPRFVVSRSPRRLGFYRNFERALSLAPRDAPYVAMADQDDRWHEDKLETLLAEIGDAQLVYSDARIIDGGGRVLSDTFWRERRNNHSDLLSLLVANAVTGAASLMRRELLDYALPFPPAQFAHFHDHWVGLTALMLGEIAFVERPLYDYVQHGEAVLGHENATRMVALRERAGALRRDPRERVRMWRMHYFVDVCRLMQFAAVLLMRCGERATPAKRRTLEHFLGSERSLPAVARLAGRGLRELGGRRPETLGAEWMLFHAFAWRRLLSATNRERPVRGLRLDAVPPPALDPKPGARTPDNPGPRLIAEKTAPLRLAISDDAPPRINLLIPTIDLAHFFGGYIAKFNLASRLAERGQRVRLVTVDPVGPLPGEWRRTLESYSGLAGFFDRIEVEFGRESQGVEISRSDRFIATTWWTAHIAADAVRALGHERFLYLIQEYEPFTFPMGSFAAVASQSYEFGHVALFSTELLRDYFRRHGIGVYKEGAEVGDARSASFDNAITAVDPPSADELRGRASRRLLFYARPEPHAARNMFELGVLGLGRAIDAGAFGPEWELHGIGALELGRQIAFGRGMTLQLLPRSDQRGYARLLRDHDVGLALMYTPHPSLVPVEMASAGMLTVTNSFENKTAEALSAISRNLVTAEPTVEGVAAALGEAAASVGDFERRARGAGLGWSRDWRRSFDDALLTRILALLDG